MHHMQLSSYRELLQQRARIPLMFDLKKTETGMLGRTMSIKVGNCLATPKEGWPLDVLYQQKSLS